MGVYRLAKTARAGCSNTECKNSGVKIGKGELRFGSQYTFEERTAWKWKHWGCVTPKQIENLEETIEGNLDFLDGYDEIDEESQAKVRKALEDGHVADNEWKGDPEMNRNGANGYRSPAKKKAMRAAKKAEEAGTDTDGATSPSKPASKKRGRGKADNIQEKPPKKKAKTSSKKALKSKVEDDAESLGNSATSEVETPFKTTPKAKRSSTAREKKPVIEEEEKGTVLNGRVTGKSLSRKRGPPRKAKSQVHVADEESDAENSADSASEAVVEPVKAGRGRKSKNAK